jgi:nitrate reductase NapE component
METYVLAICIIDKSFCVHAFGLWNFWSVFLAVWLNQKVNGPPPGIFY